MANKIKMQAQYEIAEVVTFAAVVPKDNIVRVTANNTVNQAVATHVPRGYVVTPAKAANETGVVMLKGRAILKIKASATIAANDEVKMAALSGSDQQVAPWVQGTDNENLKVGWALSGASSGSDATIVLY